MAVAVNGAERNSITEAELLLVEGKDEVNFLYALKAHLGISGVQILDMQGKHDWPTKLRTLKMTPGFSNVVSLGLVRDANSDASGAFQSVCNALRQVDLHVPARQLVPEGSSPQVVIMILPHGANQGMLEDVCLQSVADDTAMTCVEEYFECIQRNLGSLPSDLSKAKVHAFLASRPEPDLRLGEAAFKGYWPWDSQAFDHAKALLKMLVQS